MKTPAPLKSIFFDLDGTLLDTAPDFTLVLNRMLAEEAKPPLPSALVREHVSNGARALVKLAFAIDEQHPEFSQRLSRLLDVYEEQIADTQSRLFVGMEEVLDAIASRGLNWGIVTNKPLRFAEPLLKKLALLDDCSSLICPDHVTNTKPDPEGLFLACRQCGSSPAQSIYIGDHARDIDAGKNAGMLTIAAAYGYVPGPATVAQWRADRVAVSARDIEKHLFNS